MSYRRADNDNISHAAEAASSESVESEMQKRKCPMCDKITDKKFRPFCSKRCADLDLSRWLDGKYAIPATEDDDEDGVIPSQELDFEKKIKEID
ncbi:MAG: DNA gyrase inhibitor YacG [Methyloligellaceae bacterium]